MRRRTGLLSLSSACARGLHSLSSAPIPATHNERHRLLAADGDGGRNLLIPPDGEGADGVAGLPEHGLLARQLLQDLW